MPILFARGSLNGQYKFYLIIKFSWTIVLRFISEHDRTGYGRSDAILSLLPHKVGKFHSSSLIQLLEVMSSLLLKNQYNWLILPFIVFSESVAVSFFWSIATI